MAPGGDPSTLFDLAILGQVLEQHRPRLLAMLCRRIDPTLHGRLDAEEILTAAFLVARRHWPAFQQTKSVSTYSWLYRITRDCLLEAWRRERRGCRDARKEMPWPDQSSLQLGLGLVSPGTSPSKAVEREEIKEHVRQMLGMLSERDRDILWLRYFDGLTFPEVAEVLGITENAAAVRHVRALNRLRAAWQKLFPGDDPCR